MKYLNDPQKAALHDISAFQKEQKIKTFDENKDRWNIKSNQLNTKEQRKLNAELGIHKLNMTKENMARFKKIIV